MQGEKHKSLPNTFFADMAKLASQLICNQWTGGSSPSIGSA